jgi:hypothetical protein
MKRIAKVVLVGGFVAATQTAAADSSVFRPEAPRFSNEAGVGETYPAQQPVSPYVGRSEYPLDAASPREQVTPPVRSTYEEYSDSQAAGSDHFPAQVIGAH